MASLIDFVIIAVALWAIVGAAKRIAGGGNEPPQIEKKD